MERPRAGLHFVLVHYDGVTPSAPNGVDGFRHAAAANPTTYGLTVRLPGEFPTIHRDYPDLVVATTHARLRIYPENPGSALRVGGVTIDNDGWQPSAPFTEVAAGEPSHNIQLDRWELYTNVSIEVTDGDVTRTHWLAIDPPPEIAPPTRTPTRSRTYYRLTSEASVTEGQDAALTLTLGEPAPAGGLRFTVNAGYGAATAADVGAITSPVTVPEGATTLAISIPTVDDEQREDDETFTVTVAPVRPDWGPDPEGAGTATVTIADNDGSGSGAATSEPTPTPEPTNTPTPTPTPTNTPTQTPTPEPTNTPTPTPTPTNTPTQTPTPELTNTPTPTPTATPTPEPTATPTPEPETSDIVARYDSDGDGKIDHSEWMRAKQDFVTGKITYDEFLEVIEAYQKSSG